MTFPQVSKYTAIVMLILGVIASLYLTEKDVVQAVALSIGSLVLCIFIYGIGVIVEELRQGNTYKFDILNKAEENKEVDSE